MTRNELLRQIKEQLWAAGIESAVFEAAELGCFVLKTTKAKLLLTGAEEVSPVEREALKQLAARRTEGYPLQYLLGEWEFYGYPFAVGEGVLIPRADTEILCDNVISYIGETERTVLDLCSGSGCIATVIAKECPNAAVYAVEKSKAAFSYLQKNIARNQATVTAICADALTEKTLDLLPPCDVIVSNPPYLTREDMEELQKEVRFEPPEALYGEADGLYFYRELTRLWKRKLKPGGRLFYEIGKGQEKAVTNILQENGFFLICETADLCGIIRTVSGSLPEAAEKLC